MKRDKHEQMPRGARESLGRHNRQKQPRIVYTKHMRKVARRNPITIIVPIMAVALFAWLAYASEPYKRLNCEDLGRCNLKTGEVYDTAKLDRRAAIMDLWNLTEADLAKPVVLWRD